MDTWFNLLLGLHVVIALAIIGLVLLQHGKGAEMGAAFGSGSSGSLFGATGSANFMSRATAVLITIFFLTSLALAYIATNRPKVGSALDKVLPTQSAPATPAPPPKDKNSKAGEVPK
jgi:preprotein translocase subunit SecG